MKTTVPFLLAAALLTYILAFGCVTNTYAQLVNSYTFLNGKLGIGVTPTDALQLYNNNANDYIRIGAPFAYQSAISLNDDTNGTDSVIYRPGGSRDLRLWTATVGDAMTINQNGNIGIGLVTPAAQLDVLGSGNGTVDLKVNGRIQTGDAGNLGGVWLNFGQTQFVGQYTSSIMGFYNAGWGVTLNNLGNVGIGTTSPSQRLDVSGNINTSGSITSAGTITSTYLSDANNAGFYVDPSGSSLVNNLFRTTGFNGREYDFNNSSFYLDPDSISILWDVRANIIYDSGNTAYYLQPRGTSNMNTIVASAVLRTQGFNGTEYDYNDANYYMNLDGDSKIWRLNTTWLNGVNTSDRRLKDNISLLSSSSSLDKIGKLQPISFDYKSNDLFPNLPEGRQIGLIAQDTEQVVPEVVGTDPKTGYKGIDYGRLTALLISGMKEQQDQLDAEKKKNAEQDQKIQELEARLERLEKQP